MAHFTHHTMPAIRPSRNNQPLPPSPPETDQEFFHAQVPAAYLVAGAELDQLAHTISTLPERSKIQYRKTSALASQNSGVRDNRDRIISRGSRNLIVVLPPSDFPLDHGQLDNVLSMGPRHRLSQGILMPLYPTMYGQLTAVAREFNFPSTVGLCLYHHITDNGITMTPRISDDAWQYLWGHLFESRLPSNGSQQLPISGRVEFDIDLKKARWFDAWHAGTLRDETIVPAPLSHAFMHHWPEDSRSTFAEEHIMNEDRWDNQTTQANSRPATVRHVPRKLSLVDRLDPAALQASYKASQAVAASPSPDHIVHHLSPIPQSAVPQPSKAELHQRVNSWRASALLDPASMAETYQPVPNAALGSGAVALVDESPLEGEAEAEAQEEHLILEDFSWSVTSAGPLSPPLDSPASLYRLPSVHLDRRVEESVLLTPSIATSWGPTDDDWLSDVSSVSRLPSPDIGGRMIESAPLTPATATSWGPADDWRSDVSSIDRLPSPDIAYRVLEDSPVNQISGAPWHMVWPWFEVRNVSLSVKSYSPWAGMSASLSSWFDVTKTAIVPSTTCNPWSGMRDHVWPWFEPDSAEAGASYSPWTIAPTKQSWPWFDIHAVQEMAAQSNSNPVLVRSISVNPWAGMPCFNIGPWHDVNGAQPHNSVVISLNQSGRLKPRYPSLDIYPAAYPYFDIYPALAEDIGRSSGPSSAGAYPILDIYPAVYPHFNLYPSITCSIISSSEKPTPTSVSVGLHSTYPLFNIYPPLCSYNLGSAYPPPAVELPSYVLLPSTYPRLTIYPPVYPHVIPYPQASAEVTRPREAKDKVVEPVRLELPPRYPVFDIYPAVYPWNLDTIYPPTKAKKVSHASVQLRSSYPWLTIYSPVYPHVIPYPQASTEVIRPGEAKDKVVQPVRLELPPRYPVFDIYPAVYPWNLDAIYPPTKAKKVSHASVQLRSSYPWLTIYSPVYPHVIPYPQASTEVIRPGEAKDKVAAPVRVKLTPQYPVLDIYPTVYPWSLHTIYPPIKVEGTSDITVRLPSRYPWLYIYPSIYPFVTPYPMLSRTCESPGSKSRISLESVKVNLDRYYPAFDLYPAAYPYFDLYPALPDIKSSSSQQERRIHSAEVITDGVSVDLAGTYPYICPYPPAYPHFDLYPHVQTHAVPDGEDLTKETFFVSSSTYPFLVIYPPVYPHFDLYPVRTVEPATREESKVPITASSYPHLVVYPPVYPYFDLYPNIPPRIVVPAARMKSAVRIYHEYPILNIYPAIYPHFDIYPVLCSVAQPLQATINTPDTELQAEVVPSPIAKQRPVKTHSHLHDEVFVKRVVWTPSGYVQDLALPNKPHDESSRGPMRRQPSVQEVRSRLARSRSETLANQQTQSSPSLPARQSQALPTAPLTPLRISSSGALAVSEYPTHASQSLPASPTSRLSQAVRSAGSSIGMQGRDLANDHDEMARSPTKSMFTSFDRRSSMIPPLSPRDLGHSQSPAQSLVLQRARAYEQSTAHSRHQSHSTRGTPLTAPSLRPVPVLPQGSKTDRSSHTLLRS